MSVVKKGDQVKVHYTGTLENGEQFDSSAGREPLGFQVGAGQMIAGFDSGVEGMSLGDKKKITIAPEDAYGTWNEENVIEFPRKNIPADIEIEKGQELMLQDQQGRPIPVVVHEVGEESVKLDANHRLAGKTLIFDVELVELNGNGPSRIIMP